MSRIRDIANILTSSTAMATDAEVTAAMSAHNTAANGHSGRGTTEQRPISPTVGDLYFDTTIGALIAYKSTGWVRVSQDPAPQIASISPTTSLSPGTNITISGASFKTGASVQFIGADGTAYSATSVTFTNDTSLTAVAPSLTVANEPYDIKVINADNQFAILENVLDAGGTPTWNTASGIIATIREQSSLSASVSATDPDGTSITYSSTDKPSWVALNSSTGALTGTSPDVASDTTYTFSITASDGYNSSSRSFSIVSQALPTVEYLVVAGGGGGGSNRGGGGGAGGLRSGSIAIPSSFLVTVGAGGTPDALTTDGGRGGAGQNSVFASISATGGGGGAGNSGSIGGNGGSGGGGGHAGVTTPGSGNLGGYSPVEGYAGGSGNDSGQYGQAGGGGGAGGVGSNATGSAGGNGGVGVQSSITGTATYYAGGGGGGGGNGGTLPGNGGTGGGGTGGNQQSVIAQPGNANTGGGGGGRGEAASPNNGGGSGVVIIAYPNTSPAITTIPGTLTYDQPTRSGYRVYRFTAGTGTVIF